MAAASVRQSRSRAKRKAAGGKLVQVFLQPVAARALSALQTAEGATQTATINKLLAKAGQR